MLYHPVGRVPEYVSCGPWPLVRRFVPVRALVLSLCRGGSEATWLPTWPLAHCAAIESLPAVSRGRLRSRADSRRSV